MTRINVNDGFNAELAAGAAFDDILEMPTIQCVDMTQLPKIVGLVPFSKRSRIKDKSKYGLCFYENDDNFTGLVKEPSKYVDDLKHFAFVVSPDNSLYRDMPLVCQLANIYRSRLIGSYLQRSGVGVITNIRWGDERTYTDMLFATPPAFMGAPHNNIVAVGSYGCVRSKDDKFHFKNGLDSLIHYLHPKAIVIYGSVPNDIFTDKILRKANFINFTDWTTHAHATANKEFRHGK